MIEHRSLKGTRGGFSCKFHRGTWIDYVIEHNALNSNFDMDVGFGRTRETKKGVYNVVFDALKKKLVYMPRNLQLELPEKLTLENHMILNMTFKKCRNQKMFV